MSQPAPQRPVRWSLALLLLALLAVPGPVASQDPTDAGARAGAEAPPERTLPLTVKPAGVRSVRLIHDPAAADDEHYLYDVVWRDGRRELVSPDEFAALLYHEFSGRNRLFAFLNITSPIGIAWVGLGLLGQVLFTGRMLVQWITSERERRSVVPVAFWWMSLAGAAMLVVYFVWRKDVIGVLGQSTGFFVYARNLRLIHRERGSI